MLLRFNCVAIMIVSWCCFEFSTMYIRIQYDVNLMLLRNYYGVNINWTWIYYDCNMNLTRSYNDVIIVLRFVLGSQFDLLWFCMIAFIRQCDCTAIALLF